MRSLMFAGAAAHSVVPLEFAATAGYALGLMVAAHAVGWPIAVGGSQRLPDALAGYLHSLGGEILLRSPVGSLADLPKARVVLFDVSPRQFVQIAVDLANDPDRLAGIRRTLRDRMLASPLCDPKR